jgi:adenylate cyclase
MPIDERRSSGGLISSKELLERTGISRVTLHNYIKLGLVPPPLIGPPHGDPSRTRKIGYFPSEVIETIDEVTKGKKMGYSLAMISQKRRAHPSGNGQASDMEDEEMEKEKVTPLTLKGLADERRGPQGTGGYYGRITEIGYPAYMVNRRWEIEWINPDAEELFLSRKVKDLPSAEDRNLFKLLLKNVPGSPLANLEDFITLNAEFASVDIATPFEVPSFRSLNDEELALLKRLWKKTETPQKAPMYRREITLEHSQRGRKTYNLICCSFREGTLMVLIPAEILLDPIMDMLLGRERVIRDLLLNKMPCFCSLCVLVADLQNSVKISADLPPAEYFELVSQIWSAMEVPFRTFRGTQGKHVGDGVVRFFLAEPESSYKHVLNAVLCGQAIKKKLAEINSEWKIKKRWTNELHFNIGIHEGREWFGYIPVNLFTALGDTVNIAGRLSDFARDGSIWTSKHLVSLLSPEIQQKLVFGIRRTSPQGEMFVPSTFSRVMDLLDLSRPENVKFVDIATISIAELIEVDPNLAEQTN